MMLKTFSKPAIKWTVAAILCATLSAGALVNAVAATATADEVTASKTYGAWWDCINLKEKNSLANSCFNDRDLCDFSYNHCDVRPPSFKYDKPTL